MNNSNPEKKENQVDSVSSQKSQSIQLPWLVDYENKIKTKNSYFDEKNLHLDSLIKGLNKIYPKIQLKKVKTKDDTLFTVIDDSYYLGESIGTTGANTYISWVVTNLTTISNITFVSINFEDGSHIFPGIWSKKEFENYSIQ